LGTPPIVELGVTPATTGAEGDDGATSSDVSRDSPTVVVSLVIEEGCVGARFPLAPPDGPADGPNDRPDAVMSGAGVDVLVARARGLVTMEVPDSAVGKVTSG